ncbi:nitroreductase [Deferribacter autotrophicus]|uniref:Nitroreductase n=1 Tax=Deferribacter autotrophicus TaxID=500465 RepID=A0A5A8F3S0_9BACT|nr:nitroreductase family protein [Deferribacter autotrophicus]KAA0258518.1 nitroreductase [Deferribacter autotrophicus]
MSFLELVNKRYSFRGYLDKEVEQEKIDYILKCANLAPSAANRQPWKIYLVKDYEVRKKLAEAYPREWLIEAPIIVVFTGITDNNWIRSDGKNYLMCDVTIIADYFILAATEVGLGTCYIAAFDEKKVIDALKLPENEIPFLITPLGYPKDGVTRPRKRKELNEIIVHV